MDRTQRFKTQFNDKSKTNQKWKNKADIRYIVRKNKIARLNQINPNLVEDRGQAMAVFDSSVTYHDMMNQCAAVNSAFQRLPADVQRRFSHDVRNLIDFVNDPQNKDECVKLGLLPQNIDRKSVV